MLSSRPPPTWNRLGRLLPRSIRELVFEPACLELWLRHARDTSAGSRVSRLRLWLTFAAYFVAVGWRGVPRYIVEGGRATRFGRILKTSAISVGVLLVVLLLPWLVELSQL